MDFKSNTSNSQAVPAEWLEMLRSAARKLDLGYTPVALRGWMPGTELILVVRKLGGTVRPAEPFYQWILQPRSVGARITRPTAPDLVRGDVVVWDFVGMVEIEIGGQRYLGLRTDAQTSPVAVDRALVLGGPTLDAVLDLAARLKETRQALYCHEVIPCGTALTPSLSNPVAAHDLILAEDFKRELLDYLDSYWRSAAICAQLRTSPTRGLLFVGAPGTGKTLMVRHLLSRYQDTRRFIYADERNGAGSGDGAFRAMVEMVGESNRPAIVVIEDIDRILESGAVTASLLLNVLDGLFQPQVPVLWLATSNDPTGLAQNLLDRPGRFDRIFVFPLPQCKQRVRLVARYSPWPVDNAVVEEIAAESEGLTGAHLKEVCYSAALASAEEPLRYPHELREQLERIREQHHRAKSYDFELKSTRVGFGR